MIDMSPSAIEDRLKRASALSDLDPETRMYGKLDMSSAGITARLREASDLYEACLKLATIGARARE